jgi:cytochrome P450
MIEPASIEIGSRTPDSVPNVREASRAEPALPPGPRHPRWLQTWYFVRRPFAFAEQCARRYGDYFTIRILGMPPSVAVSDPDAIRDLLTGDPESVVAGESNARLLEPILGQFSVLNLDGARHLRERRLLLPPFHGDRMHVYGQIMQEVTERVMSVWPVGQPFPVQREMQRITLEVILRAVFGVDDEQRDRMRTAILRFLALAEGPGAAAMAIRAAQIDLGRLTPWGRFVHYRRAVDTEIFAAIAHRRAAGTAARDDVLSLLLDARDEDGTAMSDQQLRDELFTLLMAGHETTATSLAWVFWCVLERPEVVEVIRQELRRVAAVGPLDPRRVNDLSYLDAVIKETARLHPVADGMGRLLKRPMWIGRHHLPAGASVMASSYLTHRRPDLWPEPERFRPERFVGTRPSPYAFFPFGGGVRRCLGAAFATYEMKVVLATVLSRASLRVVPGYRPRVVRRAVTLAASEGVPVVCATAC